jgi:hypothetical protein
MAALSLYSGEEYLYIGGKYDKVVRTVSEWRQVFESRQEASWPHIMPNPVDGQAHELSTGNKSFRCDAAVSAYRFVVIEFDELVKPDQFALWFTIISKNLLDVALLLDSGGKSLHAWVRVNLPDRAAWETEVGKRIYGPQGVFSCMGADRACRNPSRLSRLPGHYRAEKANWQTLLYVNPVKEGTINDPIWEV